MKQLHQGHMVALLALFLAGMYWMEDANLSSTRNGLPSSWVFSSDGLSPVWLEAQSHNSGIVLLAGLVALYTTFVGFKTRLQHPILGYGMVAVGLGGVVWKIVMYLRPHHISLQEVFPFWVLYVWAGIAASAYVLLQEQPRKKAVAPSDHMLLDDQWAPLSD